MTSFARPAHLDQALDHLAAGPWCVLAGGTDIYPAHVERPLDKPVLDISALGELRGLEYLSKGWRIGALTRWSDFARADLPPAFDGLKLAASEVGGVQIQNAGTIAGNLCNASPAADGVPPLLTLNASVELASIRGRRVLPLCDFMLGNRKTAIERDELMTAVLIPDGAGQGVSHFQKLGARHYLVISIAMAAVRVVPQVGCVAEVRVALGACSAVAQRLHALEDDLIGVPIDGLASRVNEQHLAPLSPIDDIRGTADYRMDAALILIRRSLTAATKGLR